MKINKKIRQEVIESLPEANQIRDKGLREKIYDAWTISLQESEYSRIEDIPNLGESDSPLLKIGTQADHLRGVAQLAVQIAKGFKNTFKNIDVDMDELMAGGLCHDLGKPFEYDTGNKKRWASDIRIVGEPSMRHTVYGVHIALSVGLPESIAHIIGAHSKEGMFVKRSLACEIIHIADEAYWNIIARANNL